jgi:hypothetical protein
MTFFSNSGVKFPNLEQPTRDAGQRALGAASDLWRLFAVIEGREEDKEHNEAEIIRACSEKLMQSAAIYRTILNQIPDEYVSPLTPAEMELAGIWQYWQFRLPEHRDYFMYHLNARNLYRDVILRLETLDAQLRTTVVGGNKRDLMRPVFSMMEQWEQLALLGRIIAIVNHRNLVGSER